MDRDHEDILNVRGLYKIYGDDVPGEVITKLQNGTSKEDIRSEYGLVVGVQDATFSVQRGEFFVIMGLSGSGKSTLARCLIRLVEPTTGEIIIDGEDISKYSQRELRDLRRTKLAMVFQHYGLLPHKTVLENVEYGLKTRGIKAQERHKMAHAAIERVGLQGWENDRPGSLSGGMQQRVGIARALAHNPQILLMDEPFSGLDPLIRRDMQDEFATLRAEEGITTIFVTHDLDEALKLGDRIAIMRDGEIIQIATPAELITNPADDYVERFVEGASPARFMTAGSLMESPRLTIPEDTHVEDAVQMLRDHNSSTAFVIDGRQRLTGVVTWWTLANLTSGTLRDHVQSAVSTRRNTPLDKLVPMASQADHPIAVVDRDNKLIGSVSRNDLLQTLADDLEEDTTVEEMESEEVASNGSGPSEDIPSGSEADERPTRVIGD
ncbi:MAG: quaternary amine ABC transporter ATP-binding protein [Chloroflexota bacterium]